MELDAKIIDQLREVGVISETLSAVYGRGAKSAELQALAMKRLAKQIEQTTGKSKDEAEAIAKKISNDEKSADRRKKIEDQQVQAIKKFTTDVVGMAKAGISASQSMYNTDKEFTAAVPTLELMGSAIKSVTAALSGMFAGIPFIGAAVAGLDKLSSVAVDITTQVAKMQLENAQKYVDTYRTLSKVGVTFGGDIEEMREAAAAGGLALDQYSKFVTNNIEGLSTMGGTLQMAAGRVMDMGKAALKTNSKLLTIYGGYEEVNSALAMYASTMSMYGVDTVRNQAALEAGSADYLKTLKVLQQVTGKSAEAYKSDQEKRARHAAYLQKIQEVERTQGADAAEALKRAVFLASTQIGEAAGDRLEEKIAQSTDALALNGQAISKSSLVYESFNSAAAGAADEILRAAVAYGKDTEGASKAQAAILQNSVTGIVNEAERSREIARVAYATGSETVQSVAKNTADQLSKVGKNVNMIDAVNESYKQFNKSQTEGSKGFNGAIDALKDYKIQMDELVAKSLPKVAKMATGLIELQSNLVSKFSDLGGAVNLATGAFTELVDAMNNALGRSSPEAQTQANTGSAPAREKAIREQTSARTHILAQRDKENLEKRKSYVENAINSGTDKKVAEKQAAQYFPVLGMDAIERAVKRANTEGRTQVSAQLEALLPSILEKFPGAKISSLTTGEHAKDSDHYKGRAVDFTFPGYDAAKSDEYKQILKDIGFKFVKDEYKERSANWSGEHIHAALAKGGITDGPSLAGEAGPEAVIPLPDGRNIPVKVDNSAVIDKLEEMISVIKDHSDISRKLLQVSQ